MISALTTPLAVFLLTLPAAGGGPSLTPEQWREDLQVLSRGVVETHADAFHTVSEDEYWAAVRTLEAAIPELSPQRIALEMTRLVAMVGDGHTRLSGVFGDTDFGFRWYPVNLYWFADGLYVIQAHPDAGALAGARVARIGKLSAEEAYERVKPYLAADNEQGKRAISPARMTCPEVLYHLGIIDDMKKPGFVVEKDGRRWTEHLRPQNGQRPERDYGFVVAGEGWVEPSSEQRGTPEWVEGLGTRQRFEYLADHKTLYVQHNQIRPAEGTTLAAFFDEVFDFVEANEVERFVLDLRLNSGGNNYLNRSAIVGLIAHPEINQPGRLFVIIGRRTFSAAQNLVNELEKYTEAIFVGEPTAERVNFYGDTKPVELPHSGLTARISWLWWQNLDPRDARTSTAPDLAVDLSSADWAVGRDPILETILDYRHEPLAEGLTARLAAAGINEAVTWVRSRIDSPLYRHRSFEAEINQLGYEMMGGGNQLLAVDIFRVNVFLYPDSWNVYDSLGEALAETGDTAEALSMYRQSLAINPESATGRAALTRLSGETSD